MSEQQPSDLKRGVGMGAGLMIGIALVVVGVPMMCCMGGMFFKASNDLFGDAPAQVDAGEVTP